MRKYSIFFICIIGNTIHLCTPTKAITDSLLVRKEQCVCFGSTLFLDCRNDYLAFIGFSLGFTEYQGELNKCSAKDVQSCSRVNENCTVNFDDSNDKLILFQRFSAYTRGLNFRVRQRQRLRTNCDSLNGFSNYGKFDYTCIKESSILDMCSPYSTNTGKIVYIGHFPGKTERHATSSCKCTAQLQSKSKLNVTLLAVDIRLTTKDANCTGNHSINISNGALNRTIYCQQDTVIGEYSKLLKSTTGNMSIELKLDDESDLPESVWMAVVGDSNSEVIVKCGTEPPGRYKLYSTKNPMSVSVSGITKMSSQLVSRNTDATDTDVLDSSQSLEKSTQILIYTCVGEVALVSLTVAGVCLKMRVNRWRIQKRNRPNCIDSLPGSKQSSERTNTHKVPSNEIKIEMIDSGKKVRKKSDTSTKYNGEDVMCYF